MGRGNGQDSSFADFEAGVSLVNIYVPSDPLSPSVAGIANGSAIVGTPQAEGILIDYEGDIYRASSDKTSFASRVQRAAGRHIWEAFEDGSVRRYPSSARRLVPSDALIEVGEWDEAIGEIRVEPQQEKALLNWLDRETLEEDDLLASGYRYDNQRILAKMRASGDPLEKFKADMLARQLKL
jgi:hypothetical protein